MAGWPGILAAVLVAAQSGAAFDAASVKPNTSGSRQSGIQLQLPDGFTATNQTLLALISIAYRAPVFRITGAPAWLSADRFDISAKAQRRISMDEKRDMMRALLEDRFKLRVRRDTRDDRIFLLTLARKDGRLGEKLRPTASDCAAVNAARARGEGTFGSLVQPVCASAGGLGMLRGNGVEIGSLALTLGVLMSETIVDRTGLTGGFDFELRSSGLSPAGPPSTDVDGPPPIFTALQDQLGLKLEPARGPIDVFIIEAVERPSPD